MKEKYELYKINYKKYLILLKCGNFYISLNEDAIVMNKIFNYKINETPNFMKVGFPVTSLNKVILELEKKQVNYIIVENEITFKNKNINNKYCDYLKNVNNYEIVFNRINKINRILKNNISNPNIDKILNNIERDLCKINY